MKVESINCIRTKQVEVAVSMDFYLDEGYRKSFKLKYEQFSLGVQTKHSVIKSEG